MHFDVFNGDADGLCALVQLRLADPRDSVLVSGVKRDIDLLKRVDAAAGDSVTVLDISLDKNRDALTALLAKDVNVFYVDHHQAGDIPENVRLTTLIDTDANVCTSLLVDRYLGHRFTAWAVTAAFGDNLDHSAMKAAEALMLNAEQIGQLKQLGVCINYNGYGATVEDLHLHPVDLYREMAGFRTPFDFIADKPAICQQLVERYRGDMALAWTVEAIHSNDDVAVFMLPDEAWARRVSGVWSNDLANRNPERAHAVLTPHPQGGYVVSVRAPLANKTGADELCSRFPGGGGRRAAAGINRLPEESLDVFIKVMEDFYRR